MVLAILLLVCAAMTTIGVLYSMVAEPIAAKRVANLFFSILYVVVMVLSAVALM